MNDIYYSEKQSKKRRLIFRIKMYLAGGGLILLIVLALYFLQSPLFQLKSIQVNGLKSFSQEEFINNLKSVSVNNFLASLLGSNNYLLWLKKIQYSNPAILKMTLDRDFWNRKLVFNVEEREPYGIWCFDTCYWFDNGGVLFREAPSTDGFLIYKIQDSEARTDTSSFKFENIKKILNILDERKIPVRHLDINEKLQELTVETYEGAKIIFSLRFDPTATFTSALDTIISKIGWHGLQYLDLTVENRIYYK